MAQVFNGEKLGGLADYIQTAIINKVNVELSNEEKKKDVDESVKSFIKSTFVSDNTFVKMLIDKLIECVPILTQLVYDFLKERINGLTKKGE